ncbi:hypothetical protein FQN60_014563 [Etheostoma spectabile]|uniref:Uncharacterized protein n=1 Tax=Etheostoma spectabile TaxID=54343 RepID=A0A5J5DAN6_9PERO|nr:hypothetical protein FQN60_014563 [Etheostoma spectabile]
MAASLAAIVLTLQKEETVAVEPGPNQTNPHLLVYSHRSKGRCVRIGKLSGIQVGNNRKRKFTAGNSSDGTTAGNIKGRMFMMDGQLFKEKHHRVLDGRDPNQDGCDVTRQTGTSFSSCRDVKQGGVSAE